MWNSKTSVLLSKIPACPFASPRAGQLGQQVPNAGRTQLFIFPHKKSTFFQQAVETKCFLEMPTEGN